jgi:dihydroxy-acid dehydratase
MRIPHILKNELNLFNKYSQVITGDTSNGAARAMLYSLNLSEKKLKKPFIGIGSMNYDSNPCNNHLQALSNIVKKSVNKHDMNGFTYNTIGISDGISMGTSGMKYSLPSREIIADSIETFMKGHHYDGGVCIPGCDKNLPGSLMGLIRVNRPSLIVYGGSIMPGKYNNKDVDIVSAFQSFGQMKNGDITPYEREKLLKVCCNGSGSCGGMYTANTMAIAIEAMGMSLPFSSSNLRQSNDKINECNSVGYFMKNLLEKDIKPSDIITKQSLINSIKMVIVMGGSTNAVLHLLAVARTANIKLNIDEFNTIGKNVPVVANMKPFGEYLMSDIFNMGGTPIIMKYLLDLGLLDGDCITVTGNSLKKNLENIDTSILDLDNNRKLFNYNRPLKNDSHIRIFKGNIAPNGAVGKITGKEGTSFKGRSLVFETEEDFINLVENNNNICVNKKIKGNKYDIKNLLTDKVIVIRNQGPKGSPGMPEMLKATSLINGMGLSDKVAFITDGRFSGGSHGFLIGHITPEAYDNGLISIIKNGDIIEIDAVNNTINLKIKSTTVKKRFKSTRNDSLKHNVNKTISNDIFLEKYKKTVKSASDGCITH